MVKVGRMRRATVLMSRRRIPGGLKRGLLPLWNGGHRLARRLGEYLGAIRHGRFGHCDVCGRFGPWLYQRRIIPPRLQEIWGLTPRQAEAFARKESSNCVWCGAQLRVRRLARVLLELYPVGSPPLPVRSVVSWVHSPEAKALRMAEINRIEGLHETLSSLSHLAFSDYEPEAQPGEILHGIRSEDLTRLTYPEAAFDLVLTSETLEHIPDLDAALAEIHRVLAPGGVHLFTIPRRPDVLKTYARSRLRSDGRIEHFAPEIRHPGGDVGYAVFTEFGLDFPEILERKGWDVREVFGPIRDDDLAQVFVCKKPGGAG